MPPFRFPAPAPRRASSQEEGNDTSSSGSVSKKKSRNQQYTRPDGRAGHAVDGGRSPAKRARPGGQNDRFFTDEKKNKIPETAPEIRNEAEQDIMDGFLQPGIKPVTELLQQSPEKIDSVFILKGRKGKETSLIIDMCREQGVRFSLVDETSLDRLWKGRHQGVIARLFSHGFADLGDLLAAAPGQPLPLILALDQVQDPGNAGALARTLYALGGAGIIVPRHNGVYLGAAAARVAAGALDKLAVAKAANLAQALDAALDAGFTVYGAETATRDSGAPYENVFHFTPHLPAVLVLGGEEGGLRPIIRKRCSAFVSIPFARAFDSLNVAQAGAIIISAFAATCDFSRRP